MRTRPLKTIIPRYKINEVASLNLSIYFYIENANNRLITYRHKTNKQVEVIENINDFHLKLVKGIIEYSCDDIYNRIKSL